MHPALLLDDVLRQIFNLCPESSLPAAARSCRDWRDPALDCIWSRLSSLVPLLNLIPGLSCVGGVYNVSLEAPLDLTIFHSYACRVKHITQRHDTRVHTTLLSILSGQGDPILNKLTTTRLSSIDVHCISSALSLSPSLQQLDLDMGFKNRQSLDIEDYLDKLFRIATGLDRLRLRGFASQRLNSVIARMSNLRGLSLRTGNFLTEDTLVALSAFPCLFELEVEAGHLAIDVLSEKWALSVPDGGYFRSLQKLHICAQGPLIELLLKTLRPGHLRTLRIEATTPSGSIVSWSTIFNLITATASHTLEDLTIEQHLDDIDLDITPTANANTNTHTSTHTPSRTETNRITFDIMRLLAPLRSLHSFTIDMTHMPDVDDHDMDSLATWWPTLVHLDLGFIHSSDCIRYGGPRATPACLRALATSLPKLETLILPLDIAPVAVCAPAVARRAHCGERPSHRPFRLWILLLSLCISTPCSLS
ncbi:hypothetical protein B0H10DRAFT_1126224 [Mycena sp. CBHHK59/15]|nr:hypothetical protein B0H10DRAFT_1126224 [Mycena sp. CBHHK59/15]